MYFIRTPFPAMLHFCRNHAIDQVDLKPAAESAESASLARSRLGSFSEFLNSLHPNPARTVRLRLPRSDSVPGLPTFILSSALLLGLTGNIGCGKSTAGRFLADRGFVRIDCDEIVRDLLSSDPEVKAEVADAFGPATFDAEGKIDRKALGRIVFADREALTRLETILHPRVSALWRGRVADRPGCSHVVEIPLLFEKNLQKWFDFTVCVACDRQTQLERLSRRGMTAREADQRMAVQLPLARKVELADCVLLNSGSLSFLSDQVGWLTQTRKLT